MNDKFEYIEFVFAANEPNQIAIEASPAVLEKIAKSLEKRLQELGVEPHARPSEYQNNQYFFFHVSRVDMLNALRDDDWEFVSSYSGHIRERSLYKRLITQEQSTSNKPILSDVAELIEVSNTNVVNGYLKLGWILIETGKSQHSEHGYSASYCLAWLNKNGDPVYPEIKTDKEYMDKIFRDIADEVKK